MDESLNKATGAMATDRTNLTLLEGKLADAKNVRDATRIADFTQKLEELKGAALQGNIDKKGYPSRSAMLFPLKLISKLIFRKERSHLLASHGCYQREVFWSTKDALKAGEFIVEPPLLIARRMDHILA